MIDATHDFGRRRRRVIRFLNRKAQKDPATIRIRSAYRTLIELQNERGPGATVKIGEAPKSTTIRSALEQIRQKAKAQGIKI